MNELKLFDRRTIGTKFQNSMKTCVCAHVFFNSWVVPVIGCYKCKLEALIAKEKLETENYFYEGAWHHARSFNENMNIK